MFKTINGFTKAKMIEAVNTKMMDHKSFGYHKGAGASGCLYLAQDGNRCAVGIFIPTGHPAQDSGDVRIMLPKFMDLLDVMPLKLEGLREMQRVHDQHESGDPRSAIIKWINEKVQE